MTKLSLFVSLSFLFLSQFASAQARKESASSFATSSPWSSSIKNGSLEEVIGKRSRYAKHFIKPDGSFSMYTAAASIHYNEGGDWKEIDLTVHPNVSGVHTNNPYFNGDNSFKTYYPVNPMSGKIFTRLNEGEMSETLQSMYAEDQNGNVVYQFPASASQAATYNSSVAYNNIFPFTNVRYSQQNDGRKLDVVLQSSQSLNNVPASAKYIVLKEIVQIPAGWTLSSSDNCYNLYAGSTWIANFPKPVANETESPAKNYTEESPSKEGILQIIQNGTELTFYTKFDVSWLKNSTRNFPVTLDPVVSYYPTTISMASGNMTGPALAKNSGNIRLAGAGAISWCQFNISTFPSGALITTATYWGNHFNSTGTPNKIATIVGMQAVDPITATNTAINTQITSASSPVYSSSYAFAGLTVPTWYSGALTGTATGDIATQQAQGWTALGFKYNSGFSTTAIQYGYNAALAANLPYLQLDYSTSGCTGTPLGGTATSTTLLACGDPFTLNLTGNSTGSGMTYQWQSSPPGANTWTNLGTASASSFYTTTQSSATDYQCVVTCTTSGLSGTSTIIAVGQNTINNCYCIPTGATTSSNYITGFITTGALQNVSNTPTTYSTLPAPGGYGDYTSLVVSANPGSTFNVQIQFLTGSHQVGVWADFNHDGDFNDAGENPILTPATSSPFFSTITIPAGAVSGLTRLRVRTSSSGAPSACGNSLYGEAEDYTLNVLGNCTLAAAGTIATSSYTICPLIGQQITATVPLFTLGTTYQWQSSTTSGGPYTNVTGGSGATTLSYTTAGLAPGTYYYVMETTCANCGPCTSLSNEVTVVVTNVPAPTATNSAQCAPGIPTAFVTSTAGAIGTGNFDWYSASTGGTLLQARPFGPVLPYYFNDFTSSVLTNSSISPNASITGGVLQLHPNVVAQYGAFTVNASGFNSDKYLVDFDYTTTGTLASMGEGFSYSFGNDAVSTVEASMSAESGTGTKLKVCFVAASSATCPAGIYLIYNNSTASEPTPAQTIGGTSYSNNTSFKNNSGHVTISIDSAGRVSVTLNGTAIFTNVVIPLSPIGTTWPSVNRSTWKHVWKGRTTTATMLTQFDNIDIKQSTLVTGSPTYLSSVATTTTFYVNELGTNGCASTRTPVTVTVHTPATIYASASPNDSVCTGAPVTLTGTGGVTYLWNGNPTTVNGDTTFSSALAGTYTVTGTDVNGCTNTGTINIYLHPVISGTATATPNAICPGGSTMLTSASTPICTGLIVNNFIDYYAPSLWTLTNSTANGSLSTTGSPANVVINGSTNGLPGYTAFSRKVTCSGTLSFNWNFATAADNYLDYPQYAINGGTPIDFPGYDQSQYGLTQTGAISIPVTAGDSITIYAATIGTDNIPGILTLSNFHAPEPQIEGIISMWDAATGGINLGAPPVTVNPPGTGGTVTYYAQFTASTTGCVNLVRQPVTITVHPTPGATVSGGGAVCTGSTLPDVTIALSGTAPWNITYNYNGNPVTVTGITSSPYIIPTAAAGTYDVTNVSDSNCTGGTGTGSAIVSLIALPTATLSGGGPVCAGSAMPNIDIALTGTSPWNITYTDGTTPTTVNGITSSPYTIMNAGVGTYSVTNISDSLCTGSGSNSVSVSINPLPAVTATITPATVCYANSALPQGGGAVTYVWNNGLTDNTSFVATSSDTYMVTGTDANGCTNTSTASITVNTLSSNLAQATSGNTASNTGTQNGTNNQPDGSMVMYSDPSCNLIATVLDNTGGNTLGTTTTTVTVEPTVMTWPVVGGQPYTRRWFTITPTNNTGVNADVTLYQTQADFDDYNASNSVFPDLPTGPSDMAGIANITITKVSGGILGVGTADVITPSVNWNAVTNYWELSFNVSGTFSHFFVHAANPLGSALPANVSSFTGKKDKQHDILMWTTSSEQNNAWFNLQHSTDGVQFTTIAQLSSKANGGNSSTLLNYQAINENPATGHNYYRLEQVDIDGNKTINSKLVDLIWSANGKTVTIYPNPVKDQLNIDLFSEQPSTVVVKISEMSGKVVKQVITKSQEGLNNFSIDLKAISSGIYMVQLIENGSVQFTGRIRKD